MTKSPKLQNRSSLTFFPPLWVLVWPYLIAFLGRKEWRIAATPLSVLPEDIAKTPDTLVMDFSRRSGLALHRLW